MLEDCELDDDDDEVQNDGVLMLKGAPTGAQKLAPGSQKSALRSVHVRFPVNT